MWDVLLTPLYIFIIYLVGLRIKATQILKHPEYKYFVKGLSAKMLGGIAFAFVYVFYYKGGDTITYFNDSTVINKLLFLKPSNGLSVLFGNLSPENYASFNWNTYWPHLYIWSDDNTFSVVRYTTIFNIFSFRNYLPTTLLVSCFSYIGIWNLFRLFKTIYPKYEKVFAIAILFLPSFIFWGSGIMKDTYIVGASCWITYNFYRIMIVRKKVLLNLFFFILNFIIIINIKPYVIACLIPSMLFWLNQAYIGKVKSPIFKVLVLPIALVAFSFAGLYIFSKVGQSMGDYGSLDSAIEKARVTQQDLLREDAYGSNSYNLGNIDGSLTGLLKIAPIAIYTAIYRPFITEAKNVMMLFSALENLALLIFTLVIIFKVKPKKLVSITKTNPLIQYSLVFSLILAFGVGIATANFGALVRYKIPLIPFYFSALFLIYKIYQDSK